MSKQLPPTDPQLVQWRLDIGARVRAAREGCGLTQHDLGEMLGGMRHVSVSRLERGEYFPQWATVARLANALGVSSAWLIGELPGSDGQPIAD